MLARSLSGARLRPMPQTAWATTATATIFKPRSQPASAKSNEPTPKANTVSNTADGRVNPSQAANPPGSPARMIPTVIPTWLLAGPGRNWHRATTSGVASLIQPLSPGDVLFAEVAQMGHRPAEGSQPQPQRHQKDLNDPLGRPDGTVSQSPTPVNPWAWRRSRPLPSFPRPTVISAPTVIPAKAGIQVPSHRCMGRKSFPPFTVIPAEAPKSPVPRR